MLTRKCSVYLKSGMIVVTSSYMGAGGNQWVKIREFSWFLDQLNKNYLKKIFLKDDFQSEKLKSI